MDLIREGLWESLRGHEERAEKAPSAARRTVTEQESHRSAALELAVNGTLEPRQARDLLTKIKGGLDDAPERATALESVSLAVVL